MERQQNRLNGFEVLRHCECLVNNIFNTNDSTLSQLLFDQLIGVQRHSLVVDNQESMLKDHIANGINVRIAPNHVWFDQL